MGIRGLLETILEAAKSMSFIYAKYTQHLTCVHVNIKAFTMLWFYLFFSI